MSVFGLRDRRLRERAGERVCFCNIDRSGSESTGKVYRQLRRYFLSDITRGGRFFFVPEGHAKIAQQFTAGFGSISKITSQSRKDD